MQVLEQDPVQDPDQDPGIAQSNLVSNSFIEMYSNRYL